MWDLLISTLTHWITGLDERNLMLWEFERWVYSYCKVECLVLYLIMAVLFVLLIALMIVLYKYVMKIIDLEEEEA